jgi:hypothetical protein
MIRATFCLLASKYPGQIAFATSIANRQGQAIVTVYNSMNTLLSFLFELHVSERAADPPIIVDLCEDSEDKSPTMVAEQDFLPGRDIPIALGKHGEDRVSRTNTAKHGATRKRY